VQNLPALVSLDVVETDNRIGICVEERLGERKPPLQPNCGPRGDGYGFDAEPVLELQHPLFDQMRRAQH
jgi:hypothetical protein